jgi:hypothetical protein
MNVAGKSFFRVGAVERFIQSRSRLVLPEFVSPRGFLVLWLLLCLVLVSGALAWSAEVPRFESGVAVVVEPAQAGAVDSGAGPLLLAFLPPSALPHLRAGQSLFLEGRSAAERQVSTILEVAPQVLSPSATRARFGPTLPPAQALTGPSALVVARFEPPVPGSPSQDYLGSLYPVNVRVGAQRLFWLLPIMDTIHPE